MKIPSSNRSINDINTLMTQAFQGNVDIINNIQGKYLVSEVPHTIKFDVGVGPDLKSAEEVAGVLLIGLREISGEAIRDLVTVSWQARDQNNLTLQLHHNNPAGNTDRLLTASLWIIGGK